MKELNHLEYIDVPCIEVKQPIGSFYVAAIGFKELLSISYTDIRRLETHSTDLEKYIGIQRLLSQSRVKEIAAYVNVVDATFPTGVIVQIDEYATTTDENGDKKEILAKNENGDEEKVRNVLFDKENSKLLIRNDESVAKILDGQHRLEGLRKGALGTLDDTNFQLNVTIFVDMDIEDQAITFATINKSQTKVNKSLVSDLFEYAETRSPQKTGHNIARALNQKEGSPFYEKIKILGVADKETETITQATFVGSLLKYISGNDLRTMKDRDVYKRGSVPERAVGKEIQRLIFRNAFLEKKDSEIASILWNYFDAVSDRWPSAWKVPKVDGILNKSTGFVALMKFLRDAYISFEKPGVAISKKDFSEIFARIDIAESEFNKQKYIPGGIGQSSLYKELLEKSGIKINE